MYAESFAHRIGKFSVCWNGFRQVGFGQLYVKCVRSMGIFYTSKNVQVSVNVPSLIDVFAH
jgi:hypothetical protein